MLKDPTDLSKRKPRRLRGTPANRVTNILAGSIVGLFSAVCLWFTESDNAWAKRKRENFLRNAQPDVKEEIRRQAFQDGAFGSVLRQVNERAEARAAGENVDKTVEKFLKSPE